MTRLRVWTGTRWSDVAVWNGTVWKEYVAPVFGAGAFRADFAATSEGWLSSLTPQHVQLGAMFINGAKWYVGNLPEWHRYSAGVAMTLPDAAQVRAQASIKLEASLGGDGTTGGGRIYVKAIINVPGYGDYTTTLSVGVVFGMNGIAWTTVTSDVPITLPTTGAPIECTMTLAEASIVVTGDAAKSNWQYNFWIDWFQLIGQDGNALNKLTVPAVEAIQVWDGAAWV